MAGPRSFPNRIVMGVPGLSVTEARAVAVDAARRARQLAPKLTVTSASNFRPAFGPGWFGISWEHPYVWFQEKGIQPFTMRSLAGKVIPMWVNDPTGDERKKNPKAKVRRTADGRVQVLIFRRAAKIGQRKMAWRNVNGVMTRVSVPASYPGAPGRIAVNRSQGLIRKKDVEPGAPNGGQIAKGNVGVRWRHPGMQPKKFLLRGMQYAAQLHEIPMRSVTYRGGLIETTGDTSYTSGINIAYEE